MSYLNRSDKRILKGIANKIKDNYEDEIPYRLKDSELIFIQRMKLVYNSNKMLLLEDFMDSFEGANKEEALGIMDSLLKEN